MADAFTAYLHLTNPEVGASSDTWGAKENTDRVTVDAMLSSAINGLTLSTAGSSATFGIAIGAAAGMVLASAYTKTTSAWALGSAAGSLDTGAIANNTWYHVYIIQRSDTNVVDIVISLSASSPTFPTNYDRGRRIGAMKTNGSAQWLLFTQLGDDFIWSAATADISASIGTTAALQTLGGVPTGIKVKALYRGFITNAAVNNASLILTAADEADQAPDTSTGRLTAVQDGVDTIGGLVSFQCETWTNTSAQIRARADTAGTTLRISTYGWTDPRGRF